MDRRTAQYVDEMVTQAVDMRVALQAIAAGVHPRSRKLLGRHEAQGIARAVLIDHGIEWFEAGKGSKP